MALRRAEPADIPALAGFLGDVDLTLAGLDSPTVRLWVESENGGGDGDGRLVGATGYELSVDRTHALVRSVAVAPDRRSGGHGTRLARFALEQAAAEGATTAWLCSRRSGPFWQALGFVPADRDELAAVLAETHQVRLFRDTGQLDREIAWRRDLVAHHEPAPRARGDRPRIQPRNHS